MTTERKLASIRKIKKLVPIKDADLIELALVDGWQIVVKKGEFTEGNLAIYFEIDSWIPHQLAPFLTKGSVSPREFNGVPGERLKTIKLKGQLSQGLLLPLHILAIEHEGNIGIGEFNEGDDVTETLGIQKWEIPDNFNGYNVSSRGSWPTGFAKTNQERVQNLSGVYDEKIRGQEFEESEKLDGSSATYFIDENKIFHAMSRNIDLARDENNLWWKIAIKYNLESMLTNAMSHDEFRELFPYGFSIRGEIVGPGVNGNKLQLKEIDFYVFDIYAPTPSGGDYCDPVNRRLIIKDIGLKHVPINNTNYIIQENLDDLIKRADGNSLLNPNVKREGFVYKKVGDGNFSFKAISNEFLLKDK